MKLSRSLLFISVLLTFSEFTQATYLGPGNDQCCSARLIKYGKNCDATCRKSNPQVRKGIINRGILPCCDTPNLNPNWACTTSCSAWDSPNRRCNDFMRPEGRCQ